MPSETSQRVVVVRHGETEWSLSGRHTGRNDIPLTDHGRAEASALAPALAAWRFAAVFCSPLGRARQTAELAGVGESARIDPDLQEWDYGDYNGLTAAEIRTTRPGWLIWRDGVVNGESLDDVAARADAAIARIRAVDGDVCVVAHGHLLRVLAARWCDLPPLTGAHLMLYPAAVSVLGYERDVHAILRWNDRNHAA